MRHKFATVESGKDNFCCGWCYCTKKQKVATCTLIWLPITVLVVFVLALVIRTALIESPFVLQKLSNDVNFINASAEDKLARAQRLGKAVQIKTISYNQSSLSEDALADLHKYIDETYPLLHQADFIERTIVNTFSLLYRVQGRNPTSNPYLLCAHLDVVPEGKVEDWTHPPFSGEIILDDQGQEFIWGRGTIDDKQAVFAILETLEYMVSNGQVPNRTFYVAFGHDEEVNGNQGAGHIAPILQDMLAEHNEELDFVLDEGMFVMTDVFPGVTDPIAYVGVVEKGWANLELSVDGVQGHSSTPPLESAVGILAHAIANLEDERQPSKFGDGPEYDTIRYVAPHASFIYKLALGNLWLFSGLVSKILSGDPATDAIQRTTTAVTVVKAGVKSNVVPAEAIAIVNHRIHPADNIDSVVQNNHDIIDDNRVKIKVLDTFPPTKVSSYDQDFMPFQIIVNSAYEVFPTSHVTPGTMVANTDTKHYQSLCDAIYRFQPVLLSKSDLHRFHGIDERISVDNYAQVVEFYYRLINNADHDVRYKSQPENFKLVGKEGKVFDNSVVQDEVSVPEKAAPEIPVEAGPEEVANDTIEEAVPEAIEEAANDTIEEAVPEVTAEVPEATKEVEEAVPIKAVLEEAVPVKAVPEEAVLEEAIPGEAVQEEAVPEKAVPEEAVQEEAVQEEAALEEAALEVAALEEAVQEEAVPEEAAQEEAVPEEAVQEEAVQEEAALEEAVPESEPSKEIEKEAKPTIEKSVEDTTESQVPSVPEGSSEL